MKLLSVIICSVFGTAIVTGQYDCSEFYWGYQPNIGPNVWPSHCPPCGGSYQSPIAIDIYQTQYDPDLAADVDPLVVNSEDMEVGWDFSNNGHTFVYTLRDYMDIPTIDGGGLPGVYKLKQFHMHWAEDSSSGSEHTVDGSSTPLEIQFVFWNAAHESYEAAAEQGALAVFAVLFDVVDNPSGDVWNGALGSDNAPSHALYKGECDEYCYVVTNQFHYWFQDLVDFSRFYRYYGSLTTPACTEGVIWTVFTERAQIGEQALENLRALRRTALVDSSPEEPIAPNYRPTQPLNGRVVTTSFDPYGWGPIVCYNITLGYDTVGDELDDSGRGAVIDLVNIFEQDSQVLIVRFYVDRECIDGQFNLNIYQEYSIPGDVVYQTIYSVPLGKDFPLGWNEVDVRDKEIFAEEYWYYGFSYTRLNPVPFTETDVAEELVYGVKSVIPKPGRTYRFKKFKDAMYSFSIVVDMYCVD